MHERCADGRKQAEQLTKMADMLAPSMSVAACAKRPQGAAQGTAPYVHLDPPSSGFNPDTRLFCRQTSSSLSSTVSSHDKSAAHPACPAARPGRRDAAEDKATTKKADMETLADCLSSFSLRPCSALPLATLSTDAKATSAQAVDTKTAQAEVHAADSDLLVLASLKARWSSRAATLHT